MSVNFSLIVFSSWVQPSCLFFFSIVSPQCSLLMVFVKTSTASLRKHTLYSLLPFLSVRTQKKRSQEKKRDNDDTDTACGPHQAASPRNTTASALASVLHLPPHHPPTSNTHTHTPASVLIYCLPIPSSALSLPRLPPSSVGADTVH